MRIQDQIRGRRIAKRKGAESKPFDFSRGVKVDDELPVPHHSGYVAVPDDREPLRNHQEIDD